MFGFMVERLRQKYRTVAYPKGEAYLAERFKGRPHISAVSCIACQGKECSVCMDVCPTKAICVDDENVLRLDTGLCIFCGECAVVCPKGAITFTKEYRLASTSREGLIIAATKGKPDDALPSEIVPIDASVRPYFKRSFKIREVSAAGCNACEAECNVLGTIVFDLPRFGIDYVASPRHADCMLVTGPVTLNMQLAMKKCYAVMPPPKVVVAVGTCAISGGIFKGMQGKGEGVTPHLAVDLYIPGCPPNPYTILDGLLRYLGRIRK